MKFDSHQPPPVHGQEHLVPLRPNPIPLPFFSQQKTTGLTPSGPFFPDPVLLVRRLHPQKASFLSHEVRILAVPQTAYPK